MLLTLTTSVFATVAANSLRRNLLNPQENKQNTSDLPSDTREAEILFSKCAEYEDTKNTNIQSQQKVSELLFDAVTDFKGDFTHIKHLLDQGADYNECGYGRTALMQAVESGKVEVVHFFLTQASSTTSIDTKNKIIGWTALQCAVEPSKFVPESDALAIIELLLANGANPMIVTDSGKTCFKIAKTEKIKALLRKYATKRHFLR